MRAFQIIAHRYQQNALAGLRICRGHLRGLIVPRIEAAGDEGRHHQCGEGRAGRCPAPPRRKSPEAAAPRPDALLDALPHLRAVVGGPLRHG